MVIRNYLLQLFHGFPSLSHGVDVGADDFGELFNLHLLVIRLLGSLLAERCL